MRKSIWIKGKTLKNKEHVYEPQVTFDDYCGTPNMSRSPDFKRDFTPRDSLPLLPEHALMTSVIERAVKDCTMSSVEQHLARGAYRWITSKKTHDWSFLWIVAELQLTKTIINRILRFVMQKREHLFPQDDIDLSERGPLLSIVPEAFECNFAETDTDSIFVEQPFPSQYVEQT